MRLTLESTDKLVELAGDHGGFVQARVWEGVAPDGAHVYAFVAMVAVHNAAAPEIHAQFERELRAHRAPSPAVEAIPLRQVI